MTGTKRGGLVVLAGVVTFAALVAGFLLVRGGVGDGAGTTPWRTYPTAFGPDDAWMSGPGLLVAAPSGCYLAVGSAGQGGATWTAGGDCTTPVRPTATHGPVGDALPGDDRASIIDAVPAPDGGYVAIGRNSYHGDAFAYDGYALRGDASGMWRRTADFRGTNRDADHIGPTALTVADGWFVAVGQREQAGASWRSTDGVAWREAPLPLMEGFTSTTVFDIASGGGRVVAIGLQAAQNRTPQPMAWVSTDAGATWRASPLGADDASLRTVIFDGRRFVVLGGSGGDTRSTALVATSDDGLSWTLDRSLGAAGARTVTSAVALPDGTIIAASASAPGASRPDERCATAWVGLPAGGWRAEDLGCNGVPATLAVLADGRVVGAHWSALFVRATPRS